MLGSAAEVFLLLQTGGYFADSAAVITIETFSFVQPETVWLDSTTAGQKRHGHFCGLF